MPSAAETIGFIAWPPVVGALNCSSLGGAGLRFRYLTYVRYDNITPAGAPLHQFINIGVNVAVVLKIP